MIVCGPWRRHFAYCSRVEWLCLIVQKILLPPGCFKFAPLNPERRMCFAENIGFAEDMGLTNCKTGTRAANTYPCGSPPLHAQPLAQLPLALLHHLRGLSHAVVLDPLLPRPPPFRAPWKGPKKVIRRRDLAAGEKPARAIPSSGEFPPFREPRNARQGSAPIFSRPRY